MPAFPVIESWENPVNQSAWKARLLAELSHEVRTPLAGVVGMADLLLETPLDAEQREYAEAIRACAEEMLAVLRQGIEIAELSAGGEEPEREELSLAEAFRDVLAASGGGRGRLDLEVAPDLPEVVVGDASRLKQLLAALAEHALVCPYARVQIRATGRTTGRLLYLTLSSAYSEACHPREESKDLRAQGPDGCAGECQKRLGVAVGWALVHNLTRLMGGSLTLVYKPGSPCAFSVTLPFELPKDATLSTEAPAYRVARKRAVLLVEDNEVVQRVEAHLLRRHGHEVECAASGEQAAAMAAVRRYDVVLMDMRLPDMDGFDAVRRLRELPGYENVPVIALTARVTEEYERLCLDCGMASFLGKPVEAEDLLAAIDAAVSS